LTKSKKANKILTVIQMKTVRKMNKKIHF